MTMTETIGRVSPEGELVVKLPSKLPDEHPVVVVVQNTSFQNTSLQNIFCREDIYNEDGRYYNKRKQDLIVWTESAL